jgi:hypothetical protein
MPNAHLHCRIYHLTNQSSSGLWYVKYEIWTKM